MAGVAGPMLRSSRRSGLRFLVGLGAGGVVAGALLSVVTYLFGELLRVALPPQPRLWLLASACALLGLADLANRTPHAWRQVPQSLVRALPPGRLGLVWGFDLGLLFTTQKVVSLIWAAMAAVVLVRPAAAGGVLMTVSVLAGLTIAAWSFSKRAGARSQGRRNAQWVRHIRQASGLTLLAMSLLVILQASHV